MKTFTAFFAAVILSSLSFATLAATQVYEAPQNQQIIGVIGASTQSDLGSLEEKLGEKADRLGANSFRVTSAVGNHMLHGTAVIYQ